MDIKLELMAIKVKAGGGYTETECMVTVYASQGQHNVEHLHLRGGGRAEREDLSNDIWVSDNRGKLGVGGVREAPKGSTSARCCCLIKGINDWKWSLPFSNV